MLYPQTNRCRTVFDLSGFWEIKIDPDEKGTANDWQQGFQPDALIGVPGSWNEQLAELGLMNYTGSVWYQTEFQVPTTVSQQQIWLRFGSADFTGSVWVNGEFAGSHSGGSLPFEFDITNLLRMDAANRLVVCVNNQLSHDTIPQGVSSEEFTAFRKERLETFPPTVFDFFPYGGLQRPVKLMAMHKQHISSIKIDTSVSGESGSVSYTTTVSEGGGDLRLRISLWDGSIQLSEQATGADNDTAEGEFKIPGCKFWSPDNPYLYKIVAELFDDGELLDEYSLDVGVREIKVEGADLLLNGEPLFLRGFGKHEDFAVLGKGLSYPLVVKDFQLMKWIGANSFRTSHYPYAEEILQVADRMGFVVIDEVPAVSLNFRHVTEATLANHKKALTELIERDRNHPSIISWSIANEPGIWGEEEAISEKADGYWSEIYEHTKKLDSSRPVTLPTCPVWGDRDFGYKYVDFISLNRYWGWYEIPGDLQKAGAVLKEELEQLHRKFGMPILVSEFGADTLEGEHSIYPQMFTEEYQTLLIEKYCDIIESLPFTVGEHVWNFADFRTAQHFRRVILNRKGVFTRDRNPKAAVFAIRKRWQEKQSP